MLWKLRRRVNLQKGNAEDLRGEVEVTSRLHNIC